MKIAAFLLFLLLTVPAAFAAAQAPPPEAASLFGKPLISPASTGETKVRYHLGARPSHLTPGVYDEARAVDESEARAMARRLAKEEGVFAGASSALNVVAALQLARELGPGKVVATVAVDSELKYLAGDLYSGG